MHKRLACLLILSMLLSACAPLQRAAVSVGLLAKTAVAGITGLGMTATPEPTSAPSITITPSQLETPVSMTDGSSYKAWDLVTVIDPNKAELILEHGDAYALDSGWEVDRVEFVYKWWGSEAPLMDYQYLWSSSGNYLHSSGRSIQPEDMVELLEAVSQSSTPR